MKSLLNMTNNSTILFIEDNGFEFARKFKAVSEKYGNPRNDHEVEKWLLKLFERHEAIEKIVIPIKLGKDDVYAGLRLGWHIRLTPQLKEKRFIPIIFLADLSKDELISHQVASRKEKTATLLNTPNCTLIEFDEEDIKSALQNFKKHLNEQDFLSKGLPQLIIDAPKDRGHQLANEWGCIRLAQLADVSLEQHISSDLYFKYRLAIAQTDLSFRPVPPSNLLSQDLKVLLIDDNARKGWEEVLKKVIQKHVVASTHPVNLTSIENVADFHSKKSTLNDYDLILLDLRLSKEEENPQRAIKIADFSGSKILREIKSHNRGLQTIILTASNKAWNMKYLLDEGADGYYIKETPEVNVSYDFSAESFTNFIESIKQGIQRVYLKDLSNIHDGINQQITHLIAMTSNLDFKNMLEEIETYFKVSFEMLYAAATELDETKKNSGFGYAYISLFRVVERINKYYIATSVASGVSTIANYRYNENNITTNPISTQTYTSGVPINIRNANEFSTLAWIHLDKLALSSNAFIQQCFWVIKRRNKFIHADTTMVGELLTECRKIDTEEGYKALLNILKDMICNSRFV
jgi:CheY-like chemotaxis protein